MLITWEKLWLPLAELRLKIAVLYRESVTCWPGARQLCSPEELQISPMLMSLEIWGHEYRGDSSTLEENELILDGTEWPT